MLMQHRNIYIVHIYTCESNSSYETAERLPENGWILVFIHITHPNKHVYENCE